MLKLQLFQSKVFHTLGGFVNPENCLIKTCGIVLHKGFEDDKYKGHGAQVTNVNIISDIV